MINTNPALQITHLLSCSPVTVSFTFSVEGKQRSSTQRRPGQCPTPLAGKSSKATTRESRRQAGGGPWPIDHCMDCVFSCHPREVLHVSSFVELSVARSVILSESRCLHLLERRKCGCEHGVVRTTHALDVRSGLRHSVAARCVPVWIPSLCWFGCPHFYNCPFIYCFCVNLNVFHFCLYRSIHVPLWFALVFLLACLASLLSCLLSGFIACFLARRLWVPDVMFVWICSFRHPAYHSVILVRYLFPGNSGGEVPVENNVNLAVLLTRGDKRGGTDMAVAGSSCGIVPNEGQLWT